MENYSKEEKIKALTLTLKILETESKNVYGLCHVFEGAALLPCANQMIIRYLINKFSVGINFCYNSRGERLEGNDLFLWKMGEKEPRIKWVKSELEKLK